MASCRNIKWDGNEALDGFSYRGTQQGKALGLNDQHILDAFKLGLSLNIYVNLVEYGHKTDGCIKRNFTRCKCHIKHSIYGRFKP